MTMGSDAPGGATPEPPLWEQAVQEGERLQKVLSRVGFGSRRVCEELIADRRVTVNGEIADLGRRVDVNEDEVCVDGLAIGVEPGLVYYLLNKPEGVVSTASDTHDRETVVDLVPGDVRVPRGETRHGHLGPHHPHERRCIDPVGHPSKWRSREGVPGGGRMRS